MLKTLRRLGLARGIGGSRAWLAVGLTAGGLQMARRALKREPDVVYQEELRPGQSLIIQHFPRADQLGVSAMMGPVDPVFAPGDKALLIDGKRRRYLITLRAGGEFHTHAGVTPHETIMGLPEGCTVRSTSGARYLVLRPTLSDFVLSMPRGAQVIYPKDLGPLLLLADVFPGARVLEAGVGSGAMSMTLLRAGAEVVGYEVREDFANKARSNVASFLGEGCPYRVELRDVYEGIDETALDRVVLDLPEPWRVVKHAATALRPGGILVSYLPTIGQVAQLREALDAGPFVLAETVEVLQRSWHVEGQSVRPDHRMVAHTGFLTAARRSADLPLG